MLLVFIFSLCFGCAFSGQPCCIDRQFEAKMGEVGGAVYLRNGSAMHSLTDSANVLHYDFYTKRMKAEGVVAYPNGSKIQTDILIDMGTQTTYITTQGVCTQINDNMGFALYEPCIPDDAVKIEETHVGFGVSEIPFTTWQFQLPHSDQVIRLSVTDVGCIPLFQSFFGTAFGGRTDMVFIISNFTPGLKDPRVTDLPTGCHVLGDSVNDWPEHVVQASEYIKRLSGQV